MARCSYKNMDRGSTVVDCGNYTLAVSQQNVKPAGQKIVKKGKAGLTAKGMFADVKAPIGPYPMQKPDTGYFLEKQTKVHT